MRVHFASVMVLLASPQPARLPASLGSYHLCYYAERAEAPAAKSGLLSEAAVSCSDIFEPITLKAVGLVKNRPSIVMSVVAEFIKKCLSAAFLFHPGVQPWAALLKIYSLFE